MRLLIPFLIICLFGCSAKEKMIDTNNQGQKLYYEKCNGCHRLYNKSDYEPKRWIEIMDVMKKKSHLTDDEERMIIKYLAE
jgi:hypothetical protein